MGLSVRGWLGRRETSTWDVLKRKGSFLPVTRDGETSVKEH